MPPAADFQLRVRALTSRAVDVLPQGRLQELLDLDRPLRVKLGIDPTAPDIHLGHTVVLQKLREFQDDGHTVVLIIGDQTAQVGDPTGKSSTRPVLSAAQIAANAKTFQDQAAKVLRRDRLEVHRNSAWLDMNSTEMFELLRSATVAQLLEREDFRQRMDKAQPISILEMIYPLLQGFDSVAVRADVEIGGTDQLFNLMQGRALQAQHGQQPQVVLTLPILTGLDGKQKMSKSLGNHIALTDEPSEMFGKTMSISDAQLDEWWSLLLGEARPGWSARDDKRELGRRLVERFHGPAQADAAVRSFDDLFVQRKTPENLPEITIASEQGEIFLPRVIQQCFGLSQSEARRRIRDGAVQMDGQKLDPGQLDWPVEPGAEMVLRAGKRQFARLRVT